MILAHQPNKENEDLCKCAPRRSSGHWLCTGERRAQPGLCTSPVPVRSPMCQLTICCRRLHYGWP